MPRLHQLLPVEKSVKETTDKALNEARFGLGNGNALNGFSKDYRPKDEGGDRLPSESKRVQYKAADILALVGENLIRLFDITATKEWANTAARADVKIGENVLVHDAPVTYLLFLEKQIGVMKSVIDSLPTLDPAVEWNLDSNTGLQKSAPVEVVRNRKTTKPVVLYEATERHPAQVKEVSEDVLAGYWTTVQFSGALPATQVRAMQDRLVQLREAVLHAREQANSVEAPEQNPGRAVVGFVFGL